MSKEKITEDDHHSYIFSQEEYLKQFEGDGTSEKNKRQAEALKIAVDTRKFEIELYWKRATYFWAFIAVSFTANFAVFSMDSLSEFKFLTIVTSIIGLFFSIGWYFVNRGSKFWQENWEMHVSSLEDDLIGPLFKTVRPPEDKFSQLLKGYHFSVSKVNQFLSLIIVAVWIGLFVYSMVFTFDMQPDLSFLAEKAITYKTLLFWLILLLVASLIIGFFLWSKNYLKWHVKLRNKDVKGIRYLKRK